MLRRSPPALVLLLICALAALPVAAQAPTQPPPESANQAADQAARAATALAPVHEVIAATRAYAKRVLDEAERSTDGALIQRTLTEARAAAEDANWWAAVRIQRQAIALGAGAPRHWLTLAGYEAGQDAAALEAAAAAWIAQAGSDDPAVKGPALDLLSRVLEARGADGAAWRLAAWAEAVAPTPGRAERTLWLAPGSLRLKDQALDAERPRASLCLTFSAPLKRDGADGYADYVTVTPTVDLALTVNDTRLCLEGFEHAASYDLTLRAGLPAAGPARLPASRELDIHVPARAPRVAFPEPGHVLPRDGDPEVPLSAINVTRAELALYRLGDDALAGQLREGRLFQDLSQWDAQWLAANVGEALWRGEIDLPDQPNRETTTLVPLAGLLPDDRPPGLYALTARPLWPEVKDWTAQATQWLTVTDLGLSALTGADGLTVALRRLSDARPVAGVEVRLIARNTDTLGRATTDAEGLARLPAGLLAGDGGRTPVAVVARRGGADADFAFLDLTRPAFDLSDRGVEGRPPPGPLDAFLTTERGIYRPGETVHLTALLRDDRARAATAPLTFSLLRPDGSEAWRRVSPGDGAGGHVLSLDTGADWPTGTWRLVARVDPDRPPIGSADFLLEDFVPARVEVALDSDRARLESGAPPAGLTVQADFLYGAPAADLAVTGQVRVVAAPDPFPNAAGYSFGPLAPPTGRTEPLAEARTDADGQARLPLILPALPDTLAPLEARLEVEVREPSGRVVRRQMTLPVDHRPFFIGLKPLFSGPLAADAEAAFEVIARTPDGQAATPGPLGWELIEEIRDYQWTLDGDRWQVRAVTRERSVAGGTLTLPAEGPARLARRMENGSYRLEVFDPEGRALSAVRFRAGWWSPRLADDDTPDTLKVETESAAVALGDTARVAVTVPRAGQLLVAVAHQQVVTTRALTVEPGTTTLELPVTEDWGVGAYVSATLFTPGAVDGAETHGPGRAVGLAWVGVDPAPRRLSVSLDPPAEVTPRQTVNIPLQVAGAGVAEGAVHLTLAAVDEGILGLTGFATPDPAGHYLGKRRLGVEMRDLYGRLIRPRAGGRGIPRSGGDALGGHGPRLDDSPIETVALFSGPVAVDADGRAEVALDLPDFNGRLRLMAVAWSPNAVGAAEAPLLVRDPLVIAGGLPRFLAPGDAARIGLEVHNLAATPGTWTVEAETTGALAVSPARASLELPKGARRGLGFELLGTAVGPGRLTVRLSGPDGRQRVRTWALTVRPAQTVETRHLTAQLPPGGRVTLDAEVTQGLLPETVQVAAAFGGVPRLGLAGLVESLAAYPYGCTEQTVSAALPLIDGAALAARAGMAAPASQAELDRRVARAVDRVIARQRGDGAFAAWSPRGGAHPWLSAYALDFLLRVQASGRVTVPDFALARGLDYLARLTTTGEAPTARLPALAYAHYVLARAGRPALGSLRWLADTRGGDLPTGLARDHLAAALLLAGDRARLAALDDHDPLQRASFKGGAPDYGSPLRDLAARLTLAAEHDLPGLAPLALAEEVAARRAARRWLSTQEQAWLALAAGHLLADQADSRIAVAGADPVAGPLTLSPDRAALDRGLMVANAGPGPLFTSLDVRGIPATPRAAERGRGFTIERTFHDLDGNPVDPAAVPAHAVLVALIRLKAADSRPRQALVVDLLPAGLEIENVATGRGRGLAGLDWLPRLTQPEHAERRDDRFVAALDIDGTESRALAYLVRAVTPGTYVLPAPYVEDMYRPRDAGWGAMGEMVIGAAAAQ
ncbi:alpha-2-macroglobulin family protein [Roseospirillum parvum]|uniref:Alpha-2-macroglobulin n=1 Tax=Roseospirillum parvum TaxID=83401 RepID=A0A1G7WB08_9PROT|nr:alpha-2-macroglobulin [Roseospirillum parvum]SDG69138.1 hypothetical protein SAMN05421742_102135 [Roseospirillum parvum]